MPMSNNIIDELDESLWFIYLFARGRARFKLGDINSSRREFQNHEIQTRAYSGTLQEGNTIMEGFIILIGAPSVMRE